MSAEVVATAVPVRATNSATIATIIDGDGRRNSFLTRLLSRSPAESEETLGRSGTAAEKQIGRGS
jgi:hypothetical protein